MLSQDSIDNLMQPIIDRQIAINNYVVGKIADRINEIGQLAPSDVYKLQRLLKSGSDVRKINKQLAILTNMQVKDIKKLIKLVAKDVYNDAKPYYDYRRRSYIPFEANMELQRVVSAISTQTANTYINLANAGAFMLRDLKNPKLLIPTSISQTYYSAVDEAIQYVVTGVDDYQSAMRRTLKQLNESGIRRVVYQAESGRVHSQRLDTAVRRNLLDGVRQIQQEMHNEVGRQFGADGVELSVHRYPAPDHEAIQGKQFTTEEYERLQDSLPFEDVNGVKYNSIERHIGQWNCRHFAISIIVGYTKPTYSNEQLLAIRKNNDKGYTLPNGKHLTMYQCTQHQRDLETVIRYAKDGQIMARRAGDMELAREYQAKINKYTAEYSSFSRACGLQEMRMKMSVSGYRKISTK